MSLGLDLEYAVPRSLRGLPNQLRDVRRHTCEFGQLSDRALQDAANALRDSFATFHDSQSNVTLGLAFAVEALRRTLGVELFDVQLVAARALSVGAVAEMQTGEGKTFSVVPAAVVAALRGHTVHVATPNAYLAERDFSLLRPALEVLGVSAGLLKDSSDPVESKKAAYDCEVTYGTGFEFGFDYLRDQAALARPVDQPLGMAVLGKLRGSDKTGRSTLQRGHRLAIIDEIDNVLLDDAGSPLILCDAPQGEAEDAAACLLAKSLVPKLVQGRLFQIGATGAVYLTESGLQCIHAPELAIPVKQLRRPWSEYVQQAIRAELVFRREVHYVLDEEEVRIVDRSTGRIFSDRSWSEGLHQAIEAKEGLRVSSERSVIAQITRQRYFRLYDRLAGMTGTAVGCEREFRKIYNMHVWKIPRRLPCRRQQYPTRAFVDAKAKWQAIAHEVASIHRTGRPILIGTRTILDSETMATLLRQREFSFELLNGKQDAEEAAIIASAGRKGAITIATNLAGRGTDIRLSDDVKDIGGLHVIVSEPNELERVDRQLVGRCARQGDRGTARTYVSADDALISTYGPWLERPIRRCADRYGELHIDITRRLRGVQGLVERNQAAARMELMKRDLARESLLTQMDNDS